MIPAKYQFLAVEFEPDGDPMLAFAIGQELENEGNLEGAASAYDRAYALAPDMEEIRKARGRVLDLLTVVEHGLVFRYIPGGPFLMGCESGEPDERPFHPVWLTPYWMSETPISWGGYCHLMDWEPPPRAFPRNYTPSADFDRPAFALYNENKIRLQYCEDHTTRARDWHSHNPEMVWQSSGGTQTSRELFGLPPRCDPESPWGYSLKPMIAVSWQDAEELGKRLSTDRVRYCLPSEAQWEKAARGGLIGAPHAWGESRPSPELCDFGRFGEFSIQPMKAFPMNGYGLYAMNGCVWEWTRDWYDRDYYRQSSEKNPEGPTEGEEKTLRGGSWADCAEVQTVTFRMSCGSCGWQYAERRAFHTTPTIGFRLCRMRRSTRHNLGESADERPTPPGLEKVF